MRNSQQLLVAALFLTFSAIFCAGEISDSISDILQTEQYLFFAQDGHYRYSEHNISIGKCPQVMNNGKPTSESIYTRYVNIHLMRDPTGAFSPKLLVIKRKGDFVVLDVSPLNNIKPFESKFSPILEHTDEGEEKSHNEYNVKVYMKNNKVKLQTIYDTMSHVLHLFYPIVEGFDLTSYYVQEVFTDDYAMLALFNRKLNTTHHRYDWVEDPYSNKVYYKEDVHNQILLFEAPMRDFPHLLLGTKSGKKLKQVPSKEMLIGVSEGVFFGFEDRNNDGDSGITSSVITSSDSGLTIRCDSDPEVKNLAKNRKFIIIRNYDYCMLRDGSKYNKTQCEMEQEDFMKRITEITPAPFNVVMWLMISCLILISAIVLQCVYIYWLRSSFVTADDIAMQNENETEASLFIAKQRSFPTSYQDPALLDISVDKWN